MVFETDNPTEKLKQLPQVVIRPQSSQEELDYLWFVLKKIPFYRENNYTFVLPEHPLFQNLANQSPYFDTVDEEKVRSVFEAKVYDPNYFSKGLEALESERDKIEAALPSFVEFNEKWAFRLYPRYDITLTRYGPGGQYLTESGRIIMLTKEDGTFKRSHPSHTPVHEMTHLGVEENIIQRLHLSHWEKERMIDRICSTRFANILPGYSVQEQGDARIDPFVTAETLGNLPQSISKYVKQYPR